MCIVRYSQVFDQADPGLAALTPEMGIFLSVQKPNKHRPTPKISDTNNANRKNIQADIFNTYFHILKFCKIIFSLVRPLSLRVKNRP